MPALPSEHDKLWELKQDAKWGRDIETQKRAIQELGKIGTPVAQSVLEEVMTISSSDDIKRYCQGAISGIASNVKITGETGKNHVEKKAATTEEQQQQQKQQQQKQQASQEKKE